MRFVTLNTIWNIHAVFPIFGLLFAIIWSLTFEYEKATYTSCHVANILPSVSHAIGAFSPQRYIWRICVTLLSGLRFAAAFMCYNWYMRVDIRRYRILYQLLVIINITSHLIEMMALITLSSVAQADSSKGHERAFFTFVGMSQLYMFLSCILIAWSHKAAAIHVSSKAKKLLSIKICLFIFNWTLFYIAYKLFYRHDRYCEPYVHSMFALCEYLTIFTNMTFHYLVIFDFKCYGVAFVATEELVTGRFKNGKDTTATQNWITV